MISESISELLLPKNKDLCLLWISMKVFSNINNHGLIHIKPAQNNSQQSISAKHKRLITANKPFFVHV